MKEFLVFQPGMEGFALRRDRILRRIPSHHHEELEVNLVLSGKASYLFGQRRVPLMANSMIWLFPAQEHVLIDFSHDFSMWVLVFRPGLVRRHAQTGSRRILRVADPGEIFSRQIDTRRVDFLNQVYQGRSERPGGGRGECGARLCAGRVVAGVPVFERAAVAGGRASGGGAGGAVDRGGG